jgi:hypothetical protein
MSGPATKADQAIYAAMTAQYLQDRDIARTLAELLDELHGTVEPSPVPKVEVEPHPAIGVAYDSLTQTATKIAQRRAILARLDNLAREQASLLRQMKDLS